MKRTLALLFLSLALFGTPLLAKETGDKAPEKVISDDWYTYTLSGKTLGYWHVVQKRTGKKDLPIHFHIDFRLNWRGKPLQFITEIWCKEDSHYTPLKLDVRWDEGGKKIHIKGEITWKKEGDKEIGTLKGRAKFGNREKELVQKIPQNAVMDQCLLAIVRNLPFDTAKTFKFHSYEIEDMGYKPNHLISYLGKEEMERKGKKIALHKFEQKGEGIHPVYFYVNEKREVVRFVIDERKVIDRATKEEALKTVGK